MGFSGWCCKYTKIDSNKHWLSWDFKKNDLISWINADSQSQESLGFESWNVGLRWDFRMSL